eukprot:SAG31_NODE_797_length_12029_cov_13.875692_2_plen_193_part_00
MLSPIGAFQCASREKSPCNCSLAIRSALSYGVCAGESQRHLELSIEQQKQELLVAALATKDAELTTQRALLDGTRAELEATKTNMTRASAVLRRTHIQQYGSDGEVVDSEQLQALLNELASFVDKEQLWAEELVEMQKQQDQLECELEVTKKALLKQEWASTAALASDEAAVDTTVQLIGTVACLQVQNVSG